MMVTNVTQKEIKKIKNADFPMTHFGLFCSSFKGQEFLTKWNINIFKNVIQNVKNNTY